MRKKFNTARFDFEDSHAPQLLQFAERCYALLPKLSYNELEFQRFRESEEALQSEMPSLIADLGAFWKHLWEAKLGDAKVIEPRDMVEILYIMDGFLRRTSPEIGDTVILANEPYTLAKWEERCSNFYNGRFSFSYDVHLIGHREFVEAVLRYGKWNNECFGNWSDWHCPYLEPFSSYGEIKLNVGSDGFVKIKTKPHQPQTLVFRTMAGCQVGIPIFVNTYQLIPKG